MSKGMAIIGIVLGAILTGGLAGIGVATALGTAGTLFGLGAAAAGWAVGGTVGLLTAVGGTLSEVASWSGGSSSITQGSPTYSWGKLQTQTSNCLAIPIIYGEVKVAGNTIWQSGEGTSTLNRIVALCDGDIQAINDVRFNNKVVSSLGGCSYNAYLGTKTQEIDTRVTGSTHNARAEVVGSLRNTAYIALTAKASSELSGGVNLTAVVQGSKVRVFTDVSQLNDLESVPKVYSNNPAWCILDFLTRYNASGINFNEIDLQSFIDAAAYCDEQVNGQPRFTLNIILDEKKSRLDWLDNLLITCRGYIFYQNGKLALKIEQAETAMQVFDSDNILVGSERFWTTPREKKIDIFKVQYIDPQNEYARIFASAEAEEFENEQPIVQEIQAWGVTNFNQASRLAWFYLNQSKTCNKFIAFQTSTEGLDRTVGDVIEVTSTFLGYENKKMRIINLSEAQEGQTSIVCKEYNENLYSDQLGSAAPVINTINLPSAFDTPPKPTNLVLEEIGWQTAEGNHIATIKVTYDEIDYFFLNHYEISYSDDNGASWNQGNISYDNNYTIQNVKIGVTYLVKVQSVTHKNIFSEARESSILTVGKNNPPGDIVEFVVIQKGDYLKASILPPSDPDLSYFEIRKGLTWDNSELVQTFLEKTTLFKPTEEGSITYLVKAVDNVGNYSENALKTVVNISGLIPKNIIIEETFESLDYIPTQLENEILIPVMDMGVNFENYQDPKETGLNVNFSSTSSIEVQYRCGYENYKGWDEFQLDIDNCAGIIEQIGWGTFRVTPAYYNQEGLINWSEWKVLSYEPDFAGQYLQTKLVDKINTIIENIPTIDIKADIEDVEDRLLNIDIPAAKTTIEMNKNFTAPPTITLTTADVTGKTCSWRLSNVKKHYFDVELLDKDDELISGKILSAIIRGY